MATPKANVSVSYNEGLFYVDYDNIYMYQHKQNPNCMITGIELKDKNPEEYTFSEELMQLRYETFRKKLAESLCNKFPSMQKAGPDDFQDKRQTKRIITQNELFHVIIEDNTWSLAVELKHKPKGNTGLQTQMFPSFLEGLRQALFEQFDTLYVRTSSWSAEPITQNSPKEMGNVFIQPTKAYTNE